MPLQVPMTFMRIVIAIPIAAFLLRLVALPYTGSIQFGDAELYRQEALSILTGNGIVNYAVMPLYPLFQAMFGANPTAVHLADIVVSSATCLVLMRIAFLVTSDEVATIATGLVAALYPAAIAYSGFGLTETLFTFLAFCGIMFLYEGRIFLAAVALVLSILTRPTMELVAPLLVMWALLIVHKKGWISALRGLAVYAVVYLVMMSPWWYFQYGKYGEFVRLNLGFGKVLYAGNNPLNKSGGGINRADVDFRQFSDLPDLERDKAMRDAAVAYIAEDPKHFVNMSMVKLARFWRFWPYAPLFKANPPAILVALAALPLMVIGIWGLVILLLKRKPVWILVLFSGYVMAIHMITIGSIRYRFPVEHVLMIFAGAALAVAFRRLMPHLLKETQ